MTGSVADPAVPQSPDRGVVEPRPETPVSLRAAWRASELAGTVALIVLTAPAMLVIAARLFVQGGSSAVYRQTRVGRGGRRFRMLKFRTLAAGPPGPSGVLVELERGELDIGDAVALLKADAERRGTPFGRWLRRTSLDELPQLWHVLTGEMSLVGPRPLRPFEVARLQGPQLIRHEVRPGLTGLWQVAGRSDIPWEDRMALDARYVRERSIWLDLQILARTPRAVLRREGAM